MKMIKWNHPTLGELGLFTQVCESDCLGKEKAKYYSHDRVRLHVASPSQYRHCFQWISLEDYVQGLINA